MAARYELCESLDIVFEGVKRATECLKEGGPDKALKMLEQVRGVLAEQCIIHTNADPGSIHYSNIIRVLIEKYGMEDDQ